VKNIVDQFRLDGKIALITGSSQGIGFELARAYGQAGATVILNGRSEKKLESAVKVMSEENIKTYAAAFDVSNEEEVSIAIRKIERNIGVVDILVNNAGIIKREVILEMKTSDFRKVIEMDLVSVFVVSKYVVQGMIAKKAGKIINICSMMSEYGRNSLSAYSSAKGGLKLLTKNMCVEWAKHNVQVNGIGPGYIETSLTKDFVQKSHPFNKLVMMRTPAARWGKPEDLCGAALLLASNAGKFINGQVIYVDGGILANFGFVEGENI